jgi:tetrahydromethanopterin S-methyltransferase subunit F
MWFILLFAFCGLGISIAFEIHIKGRDNILTRSGQELINSSTGRHATRLFGITTGWLYSLVALALLFLLASLAFNLLLLLFGLS